MSSSRPRPASPAVAPSLLSADFARLGEALAIVDPPRDWLHCDVMDGHFVPNLTFGPMVIEAVGRISEAWRDVHLMIERPETLIPAFRKAGADLITVHLEACVDPGAVLEIVKRSGAEVGLALKPGTPFERAHAWLEQLDLLLVMTVEPGFGGQSFREGMLPKIEAARTWRDRHGARYLIEADGGITPETAPLCRKAGADLFVAGNAVYHTPDPRAALASLRAAIGRA